jgi:uncharacterized protein (DUF1800 family)
MEPELLVAALDQPTNQAPAPAQPPIAPASGVPTLAAVAAVASATALLAACGGGEEEAPLIVSPLPETQLSGLRFTQLATDADAARLLQQAQFSSTRSEISALRGEGAAMWLARQYQTPLRSSGWDWLEAQGYGAVDSNEYYFRTQPAGYMLSNQLLSGLDPMRKRMALALSEFFVSSMSSADFTWRSHAYASWWDMLVRNAFGNYRQLLEDVTMHPAMGYFLNTKGNRKEDTRSGRVPDENYSREVMQLFTIGLVNLNIDGTSKGTDSYSSDDVMNLARVFTGYDFDRSDGVRHNRPSGGTIESKDFARKPMSLKASDHSALEARFLGAVVPANTPAPQALRIALDALFNHPNVGPFFARQMIQRLVTSNPSPAYVARVARRFNDNGADVRGDLQAVWTAVLLDDEARGPAGLSEPSTGKLREPMVRFIQWARTFGASSTNGRWLLDDLSGSLGQSPLRSPSVFNFFRPGYVPPSTSLAQTGATAPEFQIVNETTVSGYLNFMQTTIERGVGSSNNVTADYSRELALVGDASELVDHLCLTLAADQVSAASRTIMVNALNARAITASSSATDRNRRVWAAILMVMGCPEYLVQK